MARSAHKPAEPVLATILRVEAREERVPLTPEQAQERLRIASGVFSEARELDMSLALAKERVKELKQSAEAKHEEGERLVADAANGTSLAPFDVLVERHPTRPFEVIEWRPPDGVAAADILELTEEGEARMAAREAQGCVIYQTRAMSSEELALAEAEDHARRNPELPLAAAAEEETGATPAAENDATPAPAKRSSVTTQCPTVRTEGLTPLLDVLCDGTGAPRRKGFCPACHAELTDAKKVGFIARRRERQRLQEEADRQLAAQAEDADDSNHGDGDGDDDEATIQ